MASEPVSFDVNQTAFPSERSKEIWYLGKNILPLDISLAEITDAEMREGCRQIYQLTREILADMYLMPEQYPAQKFDLLFNRFIKFGAVIDASGHNWLMPGAVFNKFISHFGDFETMLRKFGFSSSAVGSSIILSNEKFPLFLKYWYPLFTLCQKHGIGILSCDFRLFAKKYQLTIDDFLRTQTDRNKEYFKELHQHAISKGAILKTNFQYRKFRYINKSECVMVFEDCYPQPAVAVLYNNQYSKKRDPWTSFDLFMSIVDKQPDKDELAQYLQQHICVCTACAGKRTSDACCGRWVDIHGKRLRLSVCHTELCRYFDTPESPGAFDYDIQMLKRMIDIRVEQIAKE